MPKLFGVDIAKEIATATKNKLIKGVLTTKTTFMRQAGNLSAGVDPIETPNDFEGFVEDRSSGGQSFRQGDTRQSMRVLTIIGGSLPAGVIPKTGDVAVINGETLKLLKVKADPANAVYECETGK